MSRYLLDTDICSYIMKRSNAHVLAKLRTVSPELAAISAVTEAELLYGLKLNPSPNLLEPALEAFVRHVSVLEWGRPEAEHYAEIRSDLRKRGEMIGANDLMVAAQALAVDAILVTNNEREFRRVKNLLIENWTN